MFDDEEDDDQDDDEPREPQEFGCCLPPGECVMPGLHFPSECHTAADYEQDEDGQFLSIIAESADAVPLTDEQINALMSAANLSRVPEGWTVDAWVVHHVARAVERAHGIAAAGDKP